MSRIVTDENSLPLLEVEEKLKGIPASAWHRNLEVLVWDSGPFAKLTMVMAATGSDGAKVGVRFMAEGTYTGSRSDRQGGELMKISVSVKDKTIYCHRGLYSGMNTQDEPQKDLFNHRLWKLLGEAAYQQRFQAPAATQPVSAAPHP